MDWQRVKTLAGANAELHTIRGKPFRIVSASERLVTIKVSTGNQYTITRSNLERAEQLLQQGESIAGPAEYRDKVADERPAYAWALLRELGIA